MRNPERLAWGVLLASFFVCVTLSVSLPLGVRWYLKNACVEQQVSLEVQRAPLSVTLAGRGKPVSVAENTDNVPEDTIVTTNATAGRLVVSAPKETNGYPLAIVQIYDETEVVLAKAQSPRFSTSRLPHQIALNIKSGHVRVNVPGGDDRATLVEVQTPHGAATFGEGNYEIKVNAATEVTVRYGEADITDEAEHLVSLQPKQRAIVHEESVEGPLVAALNLIQDSDFEESLGDVWSTYNKDIEFEDEPKGEVRKTDVEGRSVVVIERGGEGHAETGLRQQLDANIMPFNFLQLHLLLRIEDQSLPVCGTDGSECPVMVRIDYKDAYGADQHWNQGFYWRPDTNATNNPEVCRTCPTRNRHIQVQKETWYPYLSPNLIPLLSSREGEAPTMIKSVTVYASGHTYKSMVGEVELIGHK